MSYPGCYLLEILACFRSPEGELSIVLGEEKPFQRRTRILVRPDPVGQVGLEVAILPFLPEGNNDTLREAPTGAGVGVSQACF